MFVAKSIATDHKDLIHDVAYDFHGRRMATTSCDQYIKIWDLINGEWTCTASWKAHSGVVWKVIWAYPEFGQVLATCSYDRTVAVWEELPTDEGQDGGHWVKRGNLVDSRSSIVDVKFAPRHHGLKLAMCSVDGNIRIYEAPDVMNLCQWNLQNEIVCKVSCTCVAWSPSRLNPPLLLVGCDDINASSSVLIYEYNEESRSWIKADSITTIPCPVRDLSFSPNLGRSFELLGVAGRDVSILQIKPVTTRKEGQGQAGPLKYEIRSVAQFSDHQAQVWRLSWNITGTILASSGDDGCVRLWKGNYMDNWRCIAVLKSGISGVQPEPIKMSETFGGAGTAEEKSVVFHPALRPSHSTTATNSAAPVWH